MRGKRAKQLREQARTETAGLPDIAYQKYAPPVYRFVDNGPVSRAVKVAIGIPLKLNPNCTRAVYQQLKRET